MHFPALLYLAFTMFSQFVVLVVAAVLSGACAQVFSRSGCPTVQTQKTLDLQRYLGDWYEIEKFYAAFESGQTCARANYTLRADGHIKILNRGYKNGQPISANGEAFVPDPVNEPAKLKLRFSSLSPWGNYWVLDTDYDNYTLIYSCSEILGLTHYEFAWILSRQKTLSDDLRKKLYAELTAYGIDTSSFKMMDQTGCPDA